MLDGGSDQPSRLTLDDVLKIVQSATLPIQKKRDLASAIRKTASWIGPAGLTHPANPGLLSAHLRKLSPAMTGLSGGAMANVRSRVRSALQLAGVDVHQGKQTNALSPEWLALFQRLGGREQRALSRFFHFASAKGWKPLDINDAHVQIFQDTLKQDALHAAPDLALYQFSRAWNRCVERIDGWPERIIGLAPRRTAYVIKEKMLPETLRYQISNHFHRLQNPPLFKDVPKAGHTNSPFSLSPKGISVNTAERQKVQLLQYLSALIAKGKVQLKEMTNFEKVLTPELAEHGLLFFFERAGSLVSSQLILIGLVLVGIAEHSMNNHELATEIRRMLRNARRRMRPREMAELCRTRRLPNSIARMFSQVARRGE
jgi:hypothetical protein